MKRILDLGCGGRKIAGAFGIDFVKHPEVDFVWDLNEVIPSKFNDEYDEVHCINVIDHLGNPMNVLKSAYNALRKDGKLFLVTDNCDYWRSHVDLGCYHATLWDIHAKDNPEINHKMMFQMIHVIRLLELIGFRIESKKFTRTEAWYKHHIDYLMPKKFGGNMIDIVAVK